MTNTKYPDAVTSQERLDYIKHFSESPWGQTALKEENSLIYDLLAMLHERDQSRFRICQCQLAGDIFLIEKDRGCEACEGGDEVSPENIGKAFTFLNKRCEELKEELNKLGWQKVEYDIQGDPIGIPKNIDIEIANVTQRGTIYSHRDIFTSISNIRKCYWRIIPELPKE